jgi:serine/threonine protein kinase
VDIWSLGITAIELAETIPPLFHLRATRAMMEIPRNVRSHFFLFLSFFFALVQPP